MGLSCYMDSRPENESRKGFNALSGLYLISTTFHLSGKYIVAVYVSMPSRAYTSFLP